MRNLVNIKDVFEGKAVCNGYSGDAFSELYVKYVADEGHAKLSDRYFDCKELQTDERLDWHIVYDRETTDMYIVSSVIELKINVSSKVDYMQAISSLKNAVKSCYSCLGLFAIGELCTESIFEFLPECLKTTDSAYLLGTKNELLYIPYVFCGVKQAFPFCKVDTDSYILNWGFRVSIKLHPKTSVDTDREFDGSSALKPLNILLSID